MACLEALKTFGWFVTPEGFTLITKGNTLKETDAITRHACDIDIKEFGSPTISKDLASSFSGPVVFQIQKMRNIAAPKSKETSSAPRLLKLILSDGHTTCQALEYEPINELSLAKTSPGTKILLRDPEVVGSYILLHKNKTFILGGKVPALVERWQVAKSITKHVREGLDGPPPWVPFGQRVAQAILTDRNFKSLETGEKDQTRDEFNVQREGAIAEATQGAVKKTFGGGVKPLPSKEVNRRDVQTINGNNFNNKKPNDDYRPSRNAKNDRRKGREKDEGEIQKPSGRVSLFAFLEDKLPASSVEVEKPVEKVPASQPKETKPTNRQIRPTYAEKYDASSRHKTFEKPNHKTKGDTHLNEKNHLNYPEKNHRPQNYNEKAPRFQRQQNNSHFQDNFMQNLIQKTNNLTLNPNLFDNNQSKQYKSNSNVYSNKIQTGYHTNNTRDSPSDVTARPFSGPSKNNPNTANSFSNSQSQNFGDTSRAHYNVADYAPKANTKPYNQQPFSRGQPRYEQQTESRQRNNFSDEIAKSIVNEPSEWKWQVGDQCMAKYWEDNRYYNASITGVTPRTCVVRFNDYGNFEEVLKEDCIPVAPGNASENTAATNQFTGSMVFRRGGNNGSGSHTKKFERETNLLNGRDFRNN